MLFYIFLNYSPIQPLMTEEEEVNQDIIYLTSYINEVFASTKITQYFFNQLDETIELSISFPIKQEINLNKFIISIEDKVIISKVMPKETAEEKYEETVKEGNIGFLSRYDGSQNNYIVNIGNIEPKQKVILNSYFIQMIGSQDMSYEFVIMEKYPTFHYKDLNKNNARNKKIKANFYIEAQSKITRIIAPFLDEDAKKNSLYEVSFDDENRKAKIMYVKNPDAEENVNKEYYGPKFGYAGKVDKPTFLTSFSILFRTENMNNPTLFCQYNHELNEISYSINYVYSSEELKKIPIPEEPDQDNKISYYLKYQNEVINESPGLFIFLIDQSGSMNGKSIILVRQALLLFIKSLPVGSYFQFIGFGTSFKKYNSIPVEYNEENVNEIIDIINNMQADMGGTNIGGPLNEIFKDNEYSKINLSKNILILTDGQVHNREECVNLITANSNKFRIHALGIGDSYDKVLIERSGKLGKGSSTFVDDIEKINIAVIDTLNKCLRPYLIDIKYNFLNYQNNIKNSILINEPLNNFAYQDDIINFSFILSSEYIIDINELFKSINIEITAKNPLNLVKERISFNKFSNIIRLKNGDEMGKMIVGNALKYNKELTDNKDKELEFSQKYQILSKNTALFAEIINDKNDLNKNKLIKVNLNEYTNDYILGFPSSHLKLGGRGGLRTHKILNYEGGIMNQALPQLNLASCTVDFKALNLFEDKEEIKDTRSNNEKEKNNSNGIDINKLIMSQDIIEGFWNENEETKKINSIIMQDKLKTINGRIKEMNKGNLETKIKYTILVIYYLNTEKSEKLKEYKLIINKARKFLINQGVKYESIIDGL